MTLNHNTTIEDSRKKTIGQSSLPSSNISPPNSKLWLVFGMTLIFLIVEIGVGLLTNSLALIADAGHMANDVISLFLSIFAISVSKLRGTTKFTFGYKRVEVFSSFINGISLIIISLLIIKEAISRMSQINEIEIQGGIVMLVAFIGLIINVLAIYLLMHEKEGSLNIEGAYHHIVADALGSIAALIAGLGILLFKAMWLDMVASVIVAFLILKSGISLTYKSLYILIQASPKDMDQEVVKKEILALTGVKAIPDFHAWRVTDGMDILTAHIVVENELLVQTIKTQAMKIAINQGFHHTTFQIECNCDDPAFNCM